MTPGFQVGCSFALTFGVPVAFAAWEYWRLGPVSWRPPPGDEVAPDPAPLPDAGVPPRVQMPLPACLMPRPGLASMARAAPDRVRELV